MHNPFDQLAKKVGKGALDASGPTVLQYEISRDAQHADLRHDPDRAREAERVRLGLLERIAAVLCWASPAPPGWVRPSGILREILWNEALGYADPRRAAYDEEAP
jgi:hypothetical protein